MSEEIKKEVQPQTEQKEETKIDQSTEIKAEQKTFTQEALDKIVHYRLQEEKRKYDKILNDQKAKEEESLRQKEISEAKTKADIEKLFQARLSEKDKVIATYKEQAKKEKIDTSILNSASKYKAINPNQVVKLIKDEVKLSEDNRIEVLDNNSNIRYNSKGELLSIEDRVQEFLDANPHFRQGSLSGQGSQSSIGGKSQKPFKIDELNMNNPEDKKRYAEYRKERDQGAIQIKLNN